MADYGWDDLVKDAEEKGFGQVAPPGDYTVRVESAESKMSSGKGASGVSNPMIQCKLKITEGPHAGKKPTSPFDHYIVKSPNAARMFLGNMNAFGITAESLTTLRPTMEQIAKLITGKTVVVTTQVDPKEPKDRDGNDRIQVKGTLKPPVGGVVAVTEFPAVSAVEQVYGTAPASVATTTDPGF